MKTNSDNKLWGGGNLISRVAMLSSLPRFQQQGMRCVKKQRSPLLFPVAGTSAASGHSADMVRATPHTTSPENGTEMASSNLDHKDTTLLKEGTQAPEECAFCQEAPQEGSKDDEANNAKAMSYQGPGQAKGR